MAQRQISPTAATGDQIRSPTDNTWWPMRAALARNDEPTVGVLAYLGVARAVTLLGKFSPATGALPLETSRKCRERRRLRQTEDCAERQRCSVGIMAVLDAVDGVTKDFDGRLWHVLVVICCARFAEILKFEFRSFC